MHITQRLLRDRAQAEDACQEAFLRAYTHLDAYKPAYRFGTWLGAIATHHCLRLLARQDLQRAGVDAALLAGILLEEGPEPYIIRQEQAESLRQTVSGLPSLYQRALVLRHWHDLSYEEIAAATGQSLGAVKTQLRRARAMLAEALRATGHAHALH
jgi:RNA polymerase sigma-70 factor (ECF subfamily)